MQPEVVRCLVFAGIRLERQREELLKVRSREALVIFELQALGTVRRDRRDPGREDRGVERAGVVAIARLEESGIDGLQTCLVVDLLGALALQDDGRDAHDAVPDGEV